MLPAKVAVPSARPTIRDFTDHRTGVPAVHNSSTNETSATATPPALRWKATMADPIMSVGWRPTISAEPNHHCGQENLRLGQTMPLKGNRRKTRAKAAIRLHSEPLGGAKEADTDDQNGQDRQIDQHDRGTAHLNRSRSWAARSAGFGNHGSLRLSAR